MLKTKAELTVAKRDREQDILGQFHLGQITRDEAGKLLSDLYQDWHDALATLRMVDEATK